MSAPPLPRLLTPAEAAPLLRCVPHTVYRMMYRGDLGYLKVAGRVYTTEAHIQDYFARQTCQPKEAGTPERSTPRGKGSSSAGPNGFPSTAEAGSTNGRGTTPTLDKRAADLFWIGRTHISR